MPNTSVTLLTARRLQGLGGAVVADSLWAHFGYEINDASGEHPGRTQSPLDGSVQLNH
jgi:hypothetical protein